MADCDDADFPELAKAALALKFACASCGEAADDAGRHPFGRQIQAACYTLRLLQATLENAVRRRCPGDSLDSMFSMN